MRNWILPLSVAVGLPAILSLAVVGCNGDDDGTVGESNCVDEVDNDNDGVTDCDDPDCASTLACDNDTDTDDTDTDTDDTDTGDILKTLGDAAAVVTGEDNDDWAGFSMGGGGDINGDGNQDIIIGAPKHDCKDAGGNTLVDSGAAYVVFGPVSGNISLSDADITICGGRADAQLGYTVALAPDVTGDGNDDIVVSAPRESAGRAFIFSGLTASPDPLIADLRAEPSVITIDLQGEGTEFRFGQALFVAAADRRSPTTVWVGSDAYSGRDAGTSNLGRTYSFPSPLDPAEEQYRASRSSTTFTGANEKEDSGGSIVVGDFDGDGENDMVIGATRAPNGATLNTGAAYVQYGDFSDRRWTLDQVDVTFSGSAENQGFGHKVANAGDLNDDGVDDLAVGALTAGNENGAVYVWFGKRDEWVSGDAQTVDVVFEGERAFDRAGHGVDGVRDMTGDGIADLAIGAIGSDLESVSERGVVYLISGADNHTGAIGLEDAAYQTFAGVLRNEQAGHRILGLGDVTGDGNNDFLVGAYRSGAAGDDTGAVYVMAGPILGN
ncbi:MAG: hypothetical protein AB8H79_01725 [Myxococcota bacterium]